MCACILFSIEKYKIRDLVKKKNCIKKQKSRIIANELKFGSDKTSLNEMTSCVEGFKLSFYTTKELGMQIILRCIFRVVNLKRV